jgi:hypothetical protein
MAMNYLCLCHYDMKTFATFGPAEFEEMARLCEPYDRQLKASGKVRFLGSLGTLDQFRTLRASGDEVTEHDGPYDNADEPFGAFFVIEADSMDEAVEIARLHPGTHLGHLMRGGIEIRPIDQLEQF